jgi:hypothetical protein
MEALLGTVVAIAMSFGFTEIKMRKHNKEYTALVERVDVMEQNLGRNMLTAMIPMSKAIKELQETVGGR